MKNHNEFWVPLTSKGVGFKPVPGTDEQRNYQFNEVDTFTGFTRNLATKGGSIGTSEKERLKKIAQMATIKTIDGNDLITIKVNKKFVNFIKYSLKREGFTQE